MVLDKDFPFFLEKVRLLNVKKASDCSLKKWIDSLVDGKELRRQDVALK